MGESAACLVRSFSQSSPTSGEEKKVCPYSKIHRIPCFDLHICCNFTRLYNRKLIGFVVFQFLAQIRCN